MTNKMPSHVRPLVTAPRLNFRQSTILTTPVDKTSLPNSGMDTVKPYCAAQPLERPMVTKELSGTRKDGNNITSVDGLLSIAKDPHSLLLKKATSMSSMNLTSLLDNCGTLRQDDIVPRSTKSEPYATTLSSQCQEQEGHRNEQHCDHDKKDDTDHDDEEWANDSKWNTLQSRLLNIITTTIHQELERHYQSTIDDTPSQQHQHTMTTEDGADDTLCKDDRSTTYSTGAPSPLSVPQWWQHGHVAVEKMVADQHQECTKTMGLLEQRIQILEQQHQQQQQQQQQTQDCPKEDTQDEITTYNALHERYMDLVTQHSHQLEKYHQLEQIHLSQSLALKQRQQRNPHPLTNTSTTTSLSSPPPPPQQQQPIDHQQMMNTGYPQHKQNKYVNTTTPLDQQIHHTHRQEHHDMVSAPMFHHHPNVASVTQKSKTYHFPHQQSTTMLPTPNASPTATQLASPTHSPVDLTTIIAPPADRHSIRPPPPQQQNKSVKLDNGYVEFMTECNGQHVLCRVKLPKDADAGIGTTTATTTINTNKNNKNTKTIPNPSSSAQSRRRHPNNHYQNNSNNNNSYNKINKTCAQFPNYQRYQSSQAQQKHHYSHHTRQYQHQHPRYHLEYQPAPPLPPPQQQQQHHRHHQQQHHRHHQQQHQQYHKYNNHVMHTSHHHPITTGDMGGKSLNPNAPVWSGSWNQQLQLQYY